MASLPNANLDDLAGAWRQRLANEKIRQPATGVYGGRNFQEARSAADELGATLLIVSAGLGLIDAATAIPAYGCTIVVGAEDSVRSRVTDRFSLKAWWTAISKASVFSVDLARLVNQAEGPILIALPETYLEMLAPDLTALFPSAQERIRIFTGAPIDRLTPALRPYRMPYDNRLDGPDSPRPGTLSDFASRALAHFVALGRGRSPQAALADDAEAVRSDLSSWRRPETFSRQRHDDKAMLELINRHWDDNGGSSSRLLRFFRDELDIACEQSRFAGLARQVRGRRK